LFILAFKFAALLLIPAAPGVFADTKAAGSVIEGLYPGIAGLGAGAAGGAASGLLVTSVLAGAVSPA
jgi:hypothetical protein